MRRSRHVSRRGAFGLLLSAALPGLAGSPLRRFAQGDRGRNSAPARRVLEAVMRDPDRARAIGTACFSALPTHERSEAILTEALCAENLHALPGPDLGSAIRRRIRRDFEEGATIDIEGWILSATEARLYALSTAMGGV